MGKEGRGDKTAELLGVLVTAGGMLDQPGNNSIFLVFGRVVPKKINLGPFVTAAIRDKQFPTSRARLCCPRSHSDLNHVLDSSISSR